MDPRPVKKVDPAEAARNQRHRFDAAMKAADQLNDDFDEEISGRDAPQLSDADIQKKEEEYARRSADIKSLFVKPEEMGAYERYVRQKELDAPAYAIVNGKRVEVIGKTRGNDGKVSVTYNEDEEDPNDIATAWGDKPSKPGWAGQELRESKTGYVVASNWRDPKKVNKQLQEAAKAAQAARNKK